MEVIIFVERSYEGIGGELERHVTPPNRGKDPVRGEIASLAAKAVTLDDRRAEVVALLFDPEASDVMVLEALKAMLPARRQNVA